MRSIIYDIEVKHKVFYIIQQGRKTGFYLTNRLSKTFFHYLQKGIMVDFEITARTKRIGHHKYYQVAHFNQVVSLSPKRVFYDIYKLRRDMASVLEHHDYYMFLDFEMTMPSYTADEFRPEIIQVGYVIAKAKGPIISSKSYYVLPKTDRTLTKRTKKFLNLDEHIFFEEAITYQKFYTHLKEVIDTYHPKFVVWGKNDVSALNDSYLLHEVEPITKDYDFIDLLKLHKDYYNLKDDLGLFKAYKTYYEVEFKQTHDANDDALVTKYVFDAFLTYMA